VQENGMYEFIPTKPPYILDRVNMSDGSISLSYACPTMREAIGLMNSMNLFWDEAAIVHDQDGEYIGSARISFGDTH
jgi:hypothetical protein